MKTYREHLISMEYRFGNKRGSYFKYRLKKRLDYSEEDISKNREKGPVNWAMSMRTFATLLNLYSSIKENNPSDLASVVQFFEISPIRAIRMMHACGMKAKEAMQRYREKGYERETIVSNGKVCAGLFAAAHDAIVRWKAVQ